MRLVVSPRRTVSALKFSPSVGENFARDEDTTSVARMLWRRASLADQAGIRTVTSV